MSWYLDSYFEDTTEEKKTDEKKERKEQAVLTVHQISAYCLR